MQPTSDTNLTFANNPGIVADRILAISANTGRDEAMKWLIDAASTDIKESARSVGYTPRTLLWYVVGKEISGDPTYYNSKSFMDALQLGPSELPWYGMAAEAIQAYMSSVASNVAD